MAGAEAAAYRHGLNDAPGLYCQTAKVALVHLDASDQDANVGHAIRATDADAAEYARNIQQDESITRRASRCMIGVMSSGQGSISNNTKGGHEVYRGSKAALNQHMRSFAARHANSQRTMVLMAPGWIRTDLGGPEALFSIQETVPQIVDVLLAQRGKPGLQFLDRFGQVVPW